MKTDCLFTIGLVLLWASLIQALPVIPRQSIVQESPLVRTDDNQIVVSTSINEVRPDCNDSNDQIDYDVHLDELVQHITTHWKFDHLDSIQTQSYKHIAAQVQQHVRITVATTTPTKLDQQQTKVNPSMDVDILMAQIFGAVQSHTQGKLPLEWDQLGDQLGKPALESFLRKIMMEQCGGPSSDDGATIISAQCLANNSDQLSAQLDRYIGTHLSHIFETMDRHVLPKLLETTSENLRGVLDYFNSVFLNEDDQELLLQVLPWQGSIKDTILDSILPSIHDDDQPFHFFTRYTCLAKV